VVDEEVGGVGVLYMAEAVVAFVLDVVMSLVVELVEDEATASLEEIGPGLVCE